MFLACHYSCQECKGPGPSDCKSCRGGYKPEQKDDDDDEDGGDDDEEDDDNGMRCVDVNECVDNSDICSAGKYCANTPGSYICSG